VNLVHLLTMLIVTWTLALLLWMIILVLG